METIEKSEFILLQSDYEYCLRWWKWSVDRIKELTQEIKDLEAKIEETEEELNNAYTVIDDLLNKIDAIKDLLF